jgi:hypothetical protein
MHVAGFIGPGCFGLWSIQEAHLEVLQVVNNLGPAKAAVEA